MVKNKTSFKHEIITRQLSVVVVSRQSEAGVAFLGGSNPLQHIKSCKNKESAGHKQAETINNNSHC